MADGGDSLFCTGLNERGVEFLTEVCSWFSHCCHLLQRGTRWTLGGAGFIGRCFGSQSHDRPCCSHKAGQKKFGGWTNEGISFYDNWTTQIKKNRADNAEHIQGVELLALQRVKAAEEIDEDGDKKPAAKNANGKHPRAQEEEEVDENDFKAW